MERLVRNELILHNYPHALIAFAVFLRGHSFKLFEYFVEIGLADKATAGGNIHDTFFLIVVEFADNGIDAVLLQEVCKIVVGVLFQETRKGGKTHAHILRQFVDCDLFGKVFVDEIEYLFHLIVALGKFGRGAFRQDAHIFRQGEFMEQDKEFHDRIESFLCRDHPEDGQYAVYFGRSECQAVFRFCQHLGDGVELAFLESRTAEKRGMKLDRDLMNVVGMAVAVEPGMFQFGAGDQYEVFFADRFVRVADDALRTGCIFYKIQFPDIMDMDRKGKRRFSAFK